jgi:preprotein translocase subunit SecE
MASSSNKKRPPKGKPLSEALRDKDAKKAADAAVLDAEFESESGAEEDVSSDEDAADVAGETPEDAAEHEIDEDGDERDEESAAAEDSDDEAVDDEELQVAASLGYARYVQLSFATLSLIAGYVISRALTEGWSELASMPKVVQALPQFSAVPHEGELLSRTTVSTALGLVTGVAIVLHYYRRPDVRSWADEVADEVTKVKWPTRKEIGNYTVIVIAGSAVLTAYLALLDRFWAFVTNLIYSTGA